MHLIFFFFQAEDGIRDLVRSRGLGDVYKRQTEPHAPTSLNDVGRMPQLQIIPRNNIGRLSDALEVVLAAEDGVGPLPWPYGWPAIAAAHASLYASVIEGWERRER